MHPVLFQLVVPAGFALPAAALLAVAIVVGRAVAWVRRARAEGEAVSFVAALRADLPFAVGLAVALVLLRSAGLLDGELRLPVHAYGTLIASAFVAGIWLAQREARRRGQDPERIADLAGWILVAALVGSRVYFILVNWSEYFGPGRMLVETPLGRIPKILAVWEGGLVFYGGFIGAALTAAWYMRRHRMGFLAHADTVIPSVAFGHFLGRLGCFSAGCCWGAVADAHLPWAVRFPPVSLAYQTFAGRENPGAFLDLARGTVVPLHPTQLYESLGELALFLVLVLVVRPRKRFDGQVLAAWLLLYAALRTVVELFRGDVERGVYAGLGAGQWTSFFIFAAGVVVWVRARQVRPALDAESGPAR